MMELNKFGIGFFLFCLFPFLGASQHFEWKAKLNEVSAPGFYRVALEPALTAIIKSDLSDLRLVNKKDNVPFFIQRNNTPEGATFIAFPILTTTTDSIATTLELDVSVKAGTDQLNLIIANTAAERFTTVSGSNDRKQWFIIKENIALTNSGASSGDHFVQSLQYPFTRYRFLKLVIGNKRTDPLNILKAGVYVDKPNAGNDEYVTNPASTFTQIDSNSKTYLHIRNNGYYLIDRVQLTVTGPKFYKREAQLFTNLNGSKRRDVISSFEIVSGQKSTITLPSVKVKEFWIEIENADNAPLKVTGICTEQLQRYLVTYLEQDREYYLLAGSENATAPRFDLAGFKDSIPTVVPTLSYSALVPNEKKLSADGDNRQWLWPAIILMILVLGWLTFRLVRDMKRTGG